MKRSIIAVAVLSSLFMSAGNAAEVENAMGTLIINGRVVGTTCQFLSGSDNATIEMSEIGIDQFDNVQVGAPVTTYSNTTSLPLKVKCGENVTPRITFSSTQFEGADLNITRNTGDAKDVGFAVFYGQEASASNQITGNKPVVLTPSDNDEYDLHFTAQYAKAGADVSKGGVKSTITMTVVAD
ncbi:fimbrial protein YehD [Escherichia marmotae]|uniref:fimbrial protein YehD n=1 Tax=Escherichia marmotae TaxID=1499973 RepID=UPI00164F73FC|nr:fimbrial protein YehD [Escherichia marmotae]HAI8685682.1 fimbrial protein YehD [Escherichia coli]MDQ9320841.1 fimbrial protein YehD [Escherichia marmotae]MEC9574642.1 fimbrial protein YehD [Escherichia marmotae]MEC9746785.1 fimbrial protein YehD [Escherichia marmotae]MEC9903600.1 fimbrial protein YehD [Escherichia marmotae]